MDKKNTEYSKVLLKQESALIWVLTISFIVLAFYCISQGFLGTLPWLTAMIGFPWTAYGVSQAFYYRKSMAENTEGGVKFESVILEAKSKMECMANQYAVNDEMYNDYNEYANYSDDEIIDLTDECDI